MFKHAAGFIGAAFVCSGLVVGAQASPETARTAAGDQTFAANAAIAGMAEVELGKLAIENAGDAKVKSFGQQMVTDHSKANDELKSIASSKGITLPTSLDAKHKALRDRLSKLSGAAFDRAYVDAMVTGHQEVAAKLKTEANSGSDAELKAFAAKTLPTVQGHLKTVQDLQKDVATPRSSSR